MTTPRAPRLLAERLEGRRLLASASTLLQYDFNAANPWQATPGAQSAGTSALLVYGGVGTIDAEASTTQTNGLRLTVNTTPATGPWTSDLSSGPLAVTNAETNLGKLTLAFSLNASQAKPVNVVVTSYDAAGNRTGALATTILPAATFYYQRYALDLSTMKPLGSGTFNPAAPKVSFDYEMSTANGWSTATAAQLRLDNVSYSKPAYYVSPSGSNAGGRTEATAFKTPQQAVDVAQPGDVILMMSGTYNQRSLNSGAVGFTAGGTPAAWVVLKNYPGQSPTIYNEAWNAVYIGNGSSAAPSSAPAIGYVEIRGLHIEGDSAKVGSRAAPDGPYNPTAANAGQYGPYAQYINQVDPRTNGNGISVDSRYEAHHSHDLRFADNVVEDCSAGGISVNESDRVQIEGNVTRNNCFWDIYGTSGISVLSASNFDATTNTVTRLVRNNVSYGNLHKEMEKASGKYTDGNGIIIDLNHNTGPNPNGVTLGRTLVTNNLCYNNGGSGIHAFSANHVDIVNNTAYLNSATDKFQTGEIFAGSSGTSGSAADVNISNNILVARVANTAAGEPPQKVTGGWVASTVSYKNNVYFGGNAQPLANNGSNIVGNVTADPKFVAPSTDPSVADFRLLASSPAINLGTPTLAPALDLIGQTRYANPDSGAYEFVPAAPTSITLAASSDTGTPGDDVTDLNNGSAASRLSFLVAGTLAGATVTLYANGVPIGSALAPAGTTTTTTTTTAVTTDGATALADGTLAITAAQTFAGAPSAASPALNLTVQTVRPTLVGTPVINAGSAAPASRSQVRTVTWTFSEPVAAPLGAFTLTDRDTGVAVSLASRTLTLVGGNVLTLTLDTPGLDGGGGGGGGGAQLFLANANYALSLSPTAVADAAGNTLDPAAGTPTFDFFKLLGDFNGSRGVTAIDYGIWRAAFGQPVGQPVGGAGGGAGGVDVAFDMNGSGSVTAVDYSIWRAQFGGSVATRDDDGLSVVPPPPPAAPALVFKPVSAKALTAKALTAKASTTPPGRTR